MLSIPKAFLRRAASSSEIPEIALAGFFARFSYSLDSKVVSSICSEHSDRQLIPWASLTYLFVARSSTVSIPKAFFRSAASDLLTPLIAETGALHSSSMFLFSYALS